MKRRTDRNSYNRRLLLVLLAVTAAVCFALVALVIALKYDGKTNQDVAKENDDKTITTENADDIQKSSQDDTENETEQLSEQNAQDNEPEKADETVDNSPDTSAEVPLSDDTWMLILANPWNKLPEGFNVELADIGGGHMVDARIVDDLNLMMSDLRGAGHSAFVCSSYRTNTKQTTLYNNEVNDYLARGYSDEDAAVEAAKWVAIPGTSEHQTGLAVDIMSSFYLVLDKGQEDTAEQQWLMENSYKYGFILRYPSDKSDITGIYYEPWHYRYVGKNAAKEIYEKGICFEEYLALQ